jgi:Fe-S-cluster containining protein
MPVSELGKPALTRCQHQRTGKGCAIYDRRPRSCRLWDCLWLSDPEATAELSRPDRSHYVIDILPDYVTSVNNETGERKNWSVLQIWISAAHPHAHRDPHLRAFLEKHRLMALIRVGSTDGFLLVPPAASSTGDWIEQTSYIDPEREHTAAERAAVFRQLREAAE